VTVGSRPPVAAAAAAADRPDPDATTPPPSLAPSPPSTPLIARCPLVAFVAVYEDLALDVLPLQETQTHPGRGAKPSPAASTICANSHAVA
jgi:hypothetical protein